MSEIKVCVVCKDRMLDAEGIGPFCPNLDCPNMDGPWESYGQLPLKTAHQVFWERSNNPNVYEYDPTDDGPETIIISSILASYPYHNPKLLTWYADVIDLRVESEFLAQLAFKIYMERAEER